MKYYKISWRRFLPLLRIHIQIPFITVNTSILHERFENDDFEYLSLGIMIHKWIFNFKLYNTWERTQQIIKMYGCGHYGEKGTIDKFCPRCSHLYQEKLTGKKND